MHLTVTAFSKLRGFLGVIGTEYYTI